MNKPHKQILKLFFKYSACIVLIALILYSVPDCPCSGSEEYSLSNNNIERLFFSGSPHHKKVALTFDDGPDVTYTLEIVNFLKERALPATFFFVGRQIESFPTIAAMVHEAGFEVGNHSYDHPNLTSIPDEAIEYQLSRTQSLLQEVTEESCLLFRPPYGATNRRARSIISHYHLIPVMWSIDSEDWKGGVSNEEILTKIEKELTPGSIILLHSTKERTLRILPKVIETIDSKGYQICTVSEMIVDVTMEEFFTCVETTLAEWVKDTMKETYSVEQPD